MSRFDKFSYDELEAFKQILERTKGQYCPNKFHIDLIKEISEEMEIRVGIVHATITQEGSS